MKVSIIIPTFNNLEYLIFFLSSIEKNSKYNHEVILHINDGTDGTLDYVKNKLMKYTHSFKNIGLCSSLNTAAKLSTTNYILYAHDDMYFCKNWDVSLENEVQKYDDNFYYLTGTNVSVSNGLINYDCGDSPYNFDKLKFDKFCNNDSSPDLQGSHWAPHLIHKDLWLKVGGFSEEFNPGDGSDPDFCMKLWLKNVRVFKCISKFKVYHFNSITTRKGNIKLNNGTKQFLLKYGFNPRFFRKYYLKGDLLSSYIGKLNEPKINIQMIKDLIINKFKYFYYKILS
jgi:glycosyltransferase involved in cell wall biosynthesis|tara:strand:- start:252 stop:1103 length:852 start_codon:yes stop_codon:yes gene_type:complete